MASNIIRVSKPERFTVLSHEMLRDARLSFAARGLLAYLLSMPDNWEIRASDLVKRSPAGRDAIYSTMRELVRLGYMQRKEIRASDGRISGTETIVYERPRDIEVETVSADLPDAARPYTENPDTAEPDTVKQGTKKYLLEEIPKERNTPSGALSAVSPVSSDPSSTLWRYGVKVLCVEGESESAVRGIIGKEMKRGATAVMAALQETERMRPVDPKSYFRAVMKKRAGASEVCANYVATAMAERRKEYEENARRGVGGPGLGRGSKENRGVQETNPRIVSVDAANAA